jgi:hypothetical protein
MELPCAPPLAKLRPLNHTVLFAVDVFWAVFLVARLTAVDLVANSYCRINFFVGTRFNSILEIPD